MENFSIKKEENSGISHENVMSLTKAKRCSAEPSTSSKLYGTTDDDSFRQNITPAYIKRKFISVLDHLDTQIGKLRIDAFGLVKKRDFLLTCIDLLKCDDQLENIMSNRRKRLRDLKNQLSRVFLQVSTIRDSTQQRLLEQVNEHINLMIGMSDPRLSLQCCEIFLNTFENAESGSNKDIDKNFELALLGCTIDDQREIRLRLEALYDYIKLQKK